MASREKPHQPGRTVASLDELAAVPLGWGVNMLDALDCGIVVCSGSGNVFYRNAAASAWLVPKVENLTEALATLEPFEPFDGWARETRSCLEMRSVRRVLARAPQASAYDPALLIVTLAPWGEGDGPAARGVVLRIEKHVPKEFFEDRLNLSKRLESLGKLAARVAHELNNPLDGILRYTNLALHLTDATPDVHKLRAYLSESRIGLMRMMQTISELLDLVRPGEQEGWPRNINDVVEEALRFTAAVAREQGIVVAADFQSANMPAIRGNRLFQVCCNLIKNAIEAMPDGGRLSVTTAVVREHVVIEVADTGDGFRDDPQRIFEPFYTTKAPGKGTGLGLSISREFIEDMGGTLDAAPGREGGAVFTVRLPVARCVAGSGLLDGEPASSGHVCTEGA